MFNQEVPQKVLYRALINAGMSHRDAMHYATNPLAVADVQAAFNSQYDSGFTSAMDIHKRQNPVVTPVPVETVEQRIAKEVILSHFNKDGVLQMLTANAALTRQLAFHRNMNVPHQDSYKLLTATMSTMGISNGITHDYWSSMLNHFVKSNIAPSGSIYNKIQAIKDMREHFTNIGLRDAKEAIEGKIEELGYPRYAPSINN